MIPGYKSTTEIYHGKKHIIYRGQRKSDSRNVVVKTPANEFPSASEIESLRHEHEIIATLDVDGVIKTHGLEEHQNRPFLILEDFSGDSVKSLLNSGALNVEACLRIAIRLSDILANLYNVTSSIEISIPTMFFSFLKRVRSNSSILPFHLANDKMSCRCYVTSECRFWFEQSNR